MVKLKMHLELKRLNKTHHSFTNKMRYLKLIGVVLYLAIFFNFFETSWSAAKESKASPVSGTLLQGYRVLPVELGGNKNALQFTVYRGDYIKFELKGEIGPVTLELPTMKVKKEIVADLTKTPFVKMKKVGAFPFSLGTTSGVIHVIEYDRHHYKKLAAAEAVDFITNTSPLILDVRTQGEYNTGHLQDSILLPVQELQHRYKELLQFKNSDVFIYCATGNRSTVAAKILIDRGFTRIYNLQKGIHDWIQNGYQVVH